jgi:hypothetical protein
MISPGLAPCIASRKVPEPLPSALVTTKFFPIGIGVGEGVNGIFVSVGNTVITSGLVAVIAGDGFDPQALNTRKKIARKNGITIFLIVFSKSRSTINFTDW